MSFEKPGSLHDWATKHNLELSQAAQEYPYVLQNFRERLAESMGITLEQLHEGDFPHGDSLTILEYNQNSGEQPISV